MRYAEYVPNPLIINRAADLWVEMLKNPRYDNGDSSFVGAVTQALAEMGAKNNTDQTLARFKTELVRILSGPHKWRTKEYPGRPSEEFEEVFQTLNVDYNPNTPLADAASAAGLDMQFPWKTSMYLENDYLLVSAGRGGPRVYHYPLADGRWLVTSLNGRDIDKIKALVEQGHLTLDLQPA